MTETARPVDPERLLAHEDFVRAVARALLRDPHAADDVVQETFVAALRTGPQRGSLRGWLGGVARFEGLLPGRYAVGTDRGSDDDELRVEVTVTEAAAEVSLDR